MWNSLFDFYITMHYIGLLVMSTNTNFYHRQQDLYMLVYYDVDW